MLFKFRKGYDLMQYTIVVRPFILKLYKIEKEIVLDLLLYLFPIQYFTNIDFKLLPLKHTGYNVKTLLAEGYIDLCIEKNHYGSRVYLLSERSHKIVMDYYKYMSGEKTIGTGTSVNPFKDENATQMDQVREKLMKDLKSRLDRFPNQFKNTFF